MPLRRKTSGRSKNNGSSELTTPNGKIETSLLKEKAGVPVIQECDLPRLLSGSWDKPQQQVISSSTRSGSWSGGCVEEEEKGGGGGRRQSSSSIARLRKTSRDCVIPENVDLSGKSQDSPLFKIEDCGYAEVGLQSRPITLQRIRSQEKECLLIRDLSESPERYGGGISFMHKAEISGLVHSEPPPQSGPFQPPSSPLLVAMRTAVDSLNQYEDFEILEEIGAGFYAVVFKVRHKPTGKLMVLKKNKRKAVSLLKEVELLKRLQHPNILHYMGACIHEGQLHPLTEFINGGALEQLIQESNVFPWVSRVRLSQDISKGMDYLHTNGMLHRDLNSKNVLLRLQGSKYTAVVADFGLAAKTIPSMKKLTRSQSIVGTPYWMAPEVLTGKPYNETADVFSYGIVLCELITRLSADPEDIPRSKDYALDVERFRKLPQVTNGSCPQEFMELAFLSSKFLPLERPSFQEITTRLHIIQELHCCPHNDDEGGRGRGGGGGGGCRRESMDTSSSTCTKPPIRLSYHLQHQSSGSMSSASLLQSLEFTPPQPRETSV